MSNRTPSPHEAYLAQEHRYAAPAMPRFDDDDDDDDDDEEEADPLTGKGMPFSPLAKRLFDARTIIISGPIDQKLAASVIAQLMAMTAENDDDITLVINSQGGHVESGDTIHDMIRFVKPRVKIVGTGWVASAGALIFVAVPKEDRFCLPNTRFLLHQPAGGMRGTASDIQIGAEEIMKMRKRLNEIFARQTGQPIEQIQKDTNRDFWLSAEEAIDYGLVGKIVETMDEVE